MPAQKLLISLHDSESLYRWEKSCLPAWYLEAAQLKYRQWEIYEVVLTHVEVIPK